jgi:hypothetical protein
MIGQRQPEKHQDAGDGDDPDRPQPRADPVRPPADRNPADGPKQL